MRILDFLHLGLTEYSAIDAVQRQLHADVKEGAEDTLILAQFHPVWTAGRHTKEEDIPDKSIPVIPVDRAGSVTWHGPGQLVVYPIVRLAQPVDTVKWIRGVEAGVLNYLREEQQLPVERIEGRAGVWLRSPERPDRKICAIGLKVAAGATLHGLALNVHVDFTHAFTGIIPCGLTDADVTSLDAEGRITDLPSVASSITKYLIEAITPSLATPPTSVTWLTAENPAI